MSNNVSNSWWESYREATNITNYYRRLTTLVNNRQDIAQRMVYLAKCRYPDQSESWYLEKIINELEQNNSVKIIS